MAYSNSALHFVNIDQATFGLLKYGKRVNYSTPFSFLPLRMDFGLPLQFQASEFLDACLALSTLCLTRILDKLFKARMTDRYY